MHFTVAAELGEISIYSRALTAEAALRIVTARREAGATSVRVFDHQESTVDPTTLRVMAEQRPEQAAEPSSRSIRISADPLGEAASASAGPQAELPAARGRVRVFRTRRSDQA